MALLAIFARKYPYFSTGKFKKTAFGNSPKREVGRDFVTQKEK